MSNDWTPEKRKLGAYAKALGTDTWSVKIRRERRGNSVSWQVSVIGNKPGQCHIFYDNTEQRAIEKALAELPELFPELRGVD